MRLRIIVPFAFALLALAGHAKADTITYTEQVDASGTLDGQNFNDALVTLMGVSNTTSVSNPVFGLFENSISTTVNVTGIGTDTFTDPIIVFEINGIPAAGFSDADLSEDILDIFDSSFVSYGLDTSIGPITDSMTAGLGDSFSTTNGSFVLNSIADNGSFSASVATAAVPEPSSLSLLGMSLLASIGLLRRRKRHH